MNSPTKEELIQAMLKLSEEDYLIVMCTLAKENPYPEKTAYITNKFQQYRKKAKGQPVSTPKETAGPPKLFEAGEQPKVKPGRDGGSSRALGSSPYASLLPDIPGASAWKVPIIFRGDLVPKGGKLFLDVEKLAMKTSWNGGLPLGCKQKHKQVGNNVAIVDEKGLLVFWAFIYRDPNSICQYITSIHRVTKAKVLGGVQISTVRDIMDKCIKGNTLIGAKLTDDLKSLSLEEEFLSNSPFSHDKTFDLQHFFVDQDRNPINLKDLVTHFFPSKSSDFQSGTHSSISDARMTMQLYIKMCELQEQYPGMTDTSQIFIKRTKKKFKFDPKDVCRCTKK